MNDEQSEVWAKEKALENAEKIAGEINALEWQPSYEELYELYEQLKEHAAGNHPLLTCPYCRTIFHYWPEDPGCHARCICGKHYFGKPPNPFPGWSYKCLYHKVAEGAGMGRCIYCGLT